jgi:hypothetical protein
VNAGALLDFDPVAHRYRVGDRELISVTQALTAAGLVDTRWFNDDAAARGTYVHAAIQLHHEGDLAEDSLDPVIQPYFTAYLKFLSETGFELDACEERLFDETLGFAGTLDLRGRIPRKSLRHPGIDIIDVKTGMVPPHVGPQTAAYARMLPRELGALRWRWALHLRADATYALLPLENRTDEAVFLAALTVANFKRGWL